MENEGDDQIIGSSSAPYTNKLAEQCGLATNFHALHKLRELLELIGEGPAGDAEGGNGEDAGDKKSVRQLDDTHLEWKAEIGVQEHTWPAEITEQEPDRAISWRAVDGKYNSGKVTFHPITSDRTRIDVEMVYDAEG
jgi:hypothetical protein